MGHVGDEVPAHRIQAGLFGQVARDQQLVVFVGAVQAKLEQPPGAGGQWQDGRARVVVAVEVVDELGLADEMVQRPAGADDAMHFVRGVVAPLDVVVSVEDDQAVGQAIDRTVQLFEFGGQAFARFAVGLDEPGEAVEQRLPDPADLGQRTLARQRRPEVQAGHDQRDQQGLDHQRDGQPARGHGVADEIRQGRRNDQGDRGGQKCAQPDHAGSIR